MSSKTGLDSLHTSVFEVVMAEEMRSHFSKKPEEVKRANYKVLQKTTDSKNLDFFHWRSAK